MMPPEDGTARPDALRVDGQPCPVGIDSAHPTFSWIVRDGGAQQPAIRIDVVALEPLGERFLWSAELPQGAAPAVRYADDSLAAFTRYRWSITVLGQRTASMSATFSTGITSEHRWADAAWIAAPPAPPSHPRGATPAPEIAQQLLIDSEVHLALLFVAVGGYALPYINGSRISDTELAPTFADYDQRVHYSVYDVTADLTPGANQLSFVLGRGFYGLTNPSPPPAWEWEKAPWHGEPCVRARLQIVYRDGACSTVATDDSWTSQRTATLYDDLYGGETWDERATFGVEEAVLVPGPSGRLQRDRLDPVRVTRVLDPGDILPRGPGEFVVDFGAVVAGRVRVHVSTEGMHELTLTHGEKLTDEGLPNAADGLEYHTDGFQTDRCVLSGPGSWAPSFTYHGFRYVHVTGWPEDEQVGHGSLQAEMLHTDAARTGAFTSSNGLLNALHDAAVRTVTMNLQGLPVDTPTYEKNGWTGDGMLGAELMLLNLESEALLEKWVDDIVDSCDADGRPQIIAPSSGWGDTYKPSPTWHSSLVLIPWWLYLYRGNRAVLERHYDAMTRYVLHELETSSGGVADSVLNDWCSPETGSWGGAAPDDHRVSGTAYLYRMLTTMAQVCQALDLASSTDFEALAAGVYRAFQREFYDDEQGLYRGVGDEGYRQTHNVLALAFELVPAPVVPAVVDSLVADIQSRGGHLNTGVLGSKYLLPVLTRHGHGALALEVATQTSFPSWGLWIESGSTTLWEHWKPESRSRSHFMFGTYEDWLFHDVLGVRPLEPAFRRFRVAPAELQGLDRASGTVPTPYGPIDISWERGAAARWLRIVVPTGCEAEVAQCGRAGGSDVTLRGGVHEMEIR